MPSYGTPYLLSLHLPQYLTALVWLAGPLSGLLVQPIIGAFSDKATFRWGRRRPFILLSAIVTSLSIIGIAYAREIGKIWANVTNDGDRDGLEDRANFAAIVVAVISFYFLDFSI